MGAASAEPDDLGDSPAAAPGTGTPGGGPGADRGESTFTVLVAAGANLGIAVAKAVAGIISGSSAMLSEAAHSVADTVTELLLLTALRRSAHPPDEAHPLGYAAARYVWALLASVATFVGGAVFAIYDGVHTLAVGEELGNPTLSYAVLGIAFLLEGFSLRTGARQMRGEARRARTPLRHYLRHTPDTTVKAVVMEDSAALVGLVLAAAWASPAPTSPAPRSSTASPPSSSASSSSTSPGSWAAPTSNSSSAAPSPPPSARPSTPNSSPSTRSTPSWN